MQVYSSVDVYRIMNIFMCECERVNFFFPYGETSCASLNMTIWREPALKNEEYIPIFMFAWGGSLILSFFFLFISFDKWSFLLFISCLILVQSCPSCSWYVGIGRLLIATFWESLFESRIIWILCNFSVVCPLFCRVINYLEISRLVKLNVFSRRRTPLLNRVNFFLEIYISINCLCSV